MDWPGTIDLTAVPLRVIVRSMRVFALSLAMVVAMSSGAWAQKKGTVVAGDIRAQLHGPWSKAVEPFRVVGNIYYVGAANIASYLIATPKGHILIDTGTAEMESVVRNNIQKLGFKVSDIEILLSGHAHFDHVQGHAAMKKASGAQVMALADDVAALEAGADRSPLADEERWPPVKVDRVLKDGDTASLGGTVLQAIWAPGHTPGCTVWTTQVREKSKRYAVAFFACAGPNAGVQLVGNPTFPKLVEDTQRGLRRLKALKPDIYLLMHPQEQFAGKVERIRAGENPHPLYDPSGWSKMLTEIETSVLSRAQAEKAKP